MTIERILLKWLVRKQIKRIKNLEKFIDDLETYKRGAKCKLRLAKKELRETLRKADTLGIEL
jgi:ferritin